MTEKKVKAMQFKAKKSNQTPSAPSDVDRDLWKISLHEAGHGLLNIHFNPDVPASAKISYSASLNCFFGLASNSFKKEVDVFGELSMAAAGHEAERYVHVLRPLPEETKQTEIVQEEAATAPSLPQWPTEPQKLEKLVFSLEDDKTHLARGIASLYPDYKEVRRWARIHRHLRSKARLLLRQRLAELQRIASILYYERNFVYTPSKPSGVPEL